MTPRDAQPTGWASRSYSTQVERSGSYFLLRSGYTLKMTQSTGTTQGRPPLPSTEDEWLRRLGPERFTVLRRAGTERPGTGDLLHEHADGSFHCGACGAALFSSATKFESGSGWPSFTDPVDREAVELIQDRSHGMLRTEVRCSTCHSHLGHVFPDGPGPTGERFCMNSLALDFERS